MTNRMTQIKGDPGIDKFLYALMNMKGLPFNAVKVDWGYEDGDASDVEIYYLSSRDDISRLIDDLNDWDGYVTLEFVDPNQKTMAWAMVYPFDNTVLDHSVGTPADEYIDKAFTQAESGNGAGYTRRR